MANRLKPDPDQFRSAYPDWVRQTSERIGLSGEGTTFGVFGAWGSGKTSATLALQEDLRQAARMPLQQDAAIAIAYIDCSALESASDIDISHAVQGELVRGGLSKPSSALDRHLFTFFSKALQVAKAGVNDPMNKAGLEAASVLAGIGTDIANQRQKQARPEIKPTIENAFIFLDDLDRCDADAAWAILRHARKALPQTKTVSAIVCDPVVLGHHISHVLGVPLAHGFQAVLKYIDVPLKVPTALSLAHRVTIESRIDPDLSSDWKLSEVACDAIGSIPMRDILVALPQTCIWLKSWDRKLRPRYVHRDELQRIAEVVFFCSLMQVCMPNAAQVIASGERQWLEFSSSFRGIVLGGIGPMRDSPETHIHKEFGGLVQEVVESRMDLVRYGRSRNVGDTLTTVENGDGEPVWVVLWDMMRN